MSSFWYASGAPAARVEPSFWPVHFRNRKLAQRGLVSESGIGLPCLLDRELFADRAESYFRTTILRLGGSISTAWLSAGCAVLLAWGTVSAQTNSQSSAPAQTKSAAKLQKVSAQLNFPQEQEITQECKFAPRAAEDRSRARPRNSGSADSRALSRRRRFRNLGRKIAERDAALPGGQWLAKQGRSGFPGIDQDGIGPRPRAFVESGKRDDVATRSAHAAMRRRRWLRTSDSRR